MGVVAVTPRKTENLGLFVAAIGEQDWAHWQSANWAIVDAAFATLRDQIARTNMEARSLKERVEYLSAEIMRLHPETLDADE